MVRRDWNHPSIILWGVRINESEADHTFYVRPMQLGAPGWTRRDRRRDSHFQASEFLEDVFTMNDFWFPLKARTIPKISEHRICWSTFTTKTSDDNEAAAGAHLRHARIHNQIASDPQYAGGIGWLAFDYNTHRLRFRRPNLYHASQISSRTPRLQLDFINRSAIQR